MTVGSEVCWFGHRGVVLDIADGVIISATGRYHNDVFVSFRSSKPWNDGLGRDWDGRCIWISELALGHS